MILINGQQTSQLDISDRGLHYGDGLFETIAIRSGRLQFWQAHMARLSEGCKRLGIAEPDQQLLLNEATQLCSDSGSAVLKIIVTRGSGGRGYRPPQQSQPTRLLMSYPWPAHAEETTPYNLRLCQTPLGSNPVLAGIKHLNRLEQVVARNEWDDDAIQEGLMTDVDGNVIEGVSSNLFVVRGGVLLTPDLSRCGVNGVMRAKVLELAAKLRIPSVISTIHRDEMTQMDEVFVTNAILGIRPAMRFEDVTYGDNPISQRLLEALKRAMEEGA